MEITGKLIQILPNVEGESARGHWVRGGFVIETGDDYPRKVAFTAFGEERVAMVRNIPMMSPVVVTFTPESREFNERWYTDLRCSRVQPFVPGQMPPAATGYAWAAGGNAPVFEKYDDYIPDALLRRAYAADRLRLDELIPRAEEMLDEAMGSGEPREERGI